MRDFATDIYLALLVCATMTPVEVGALTTCSCYTYVKQGFRWQGCRDECQKSGGDLVSMETEEEWELIKNEIQNRSTPVSSDEWYIGLYRNQTNANWTWVSGKPLTIQHWQPNKPDENFALIAKNYPAGTFGLFGSVTGHSYKAYICEETRTNNCLHCWVHPTTPPPKTVEVTSSSKPSEAHTTPVSPTEEGHVITRSEIQTSCDQPTLKETPMKSRLCSDVIIVVIPFTCVTLILLAVIGFLLSRLRKKSKKTEERNNEIIHMEATREPNDNAATARDQEPVDTNAPVLYQAALGENRSNPPEMAYASLSEASRERTEAGEDYDSLLTPSYENVEHTRKSGAGDYENMPYPYSHHVEYI